MKHENKIELFINGLWGFVKEAIGYIMLVYFLLFWPALTDRIWVYSVPLTLFFGYIAKEEIKERFF